MSQQGFLVFFCPLGQLSAGAMTAAQNDARGTQDHDRRSSMRSHLSDTKTTRKPLSLSFSRLAHARSTHEYSESSADNRSAFNPKQLSHPARRTDKISTSDALKRLAWSTYSTKNGRIIT